MYEIVKCYHADHGVSEETMVWAVNAIAPTPTGFFMVTLVLPEGHKDLTNNLYGPSCGDSPVKGDEIVRDVNDEWRGATPFVNMPPRSTRLLTVIGMSEDKQVTLFTCYGGPAAERVPSDPSIKGDEAAVAVATKFWSEHALSIAAKK